MVFHEIVVITRSLIEPQIADDRDGFDDTSREQVDAILSKIESQKAEERNFKEEKEWSTMLLLKWRLA